MNTSKQNLLYIDLLKGFAMLGVIMVHFTQNYGSGSELLDSIGFAGARCPQLFFIISAFLTWRSLSKRGGVGKPKLVAFYKGRIKKIAPLFYIALLLSTILPVSRWSEWSLGSFLSHLTFTNGLFPDWVNNWMNIEWYIADLAIFYFLVPFLYSCANSFKKSLLTLFVVTLLSVVFTVITNILFAEKIASDENYEMFFHTFFIFNQLPVIMMGVTLFYGIDYIHRKNISPWKTVCILTFISIVICGAFIVFHLNKRMLTSSFIAGLLFCCLFLFCGICLPKKHPKGRKIWFSKALVSIGKHSYGIYCFHYIIIECLMMIPAVRSYNGTLIAWVLVFFVIVLSSYIIGRVFESIYEILENKYVRNHNGLDRE